MSDPKSDNPENSASADDAKPAPPKKDKMPNEIGGPEGPEPTRYGDWERKGIISDF